MVTFYISIFLYYYLASDFVKFMPSVEGVMVAAEEPLAMV